MLTLVDILAGSAILLIGILIGWMAGYIDHG